MGPKKTSKKKRFHMFTIPITPKEGRGIGDNPNDVIDAFEPEWDNL